MKLCSRLIFCFAVSIQFYRAKSNRNGISEKEDYGKLFIESVNFDSDEKQKEIIRQIFQMRLDPEVPQKLKSIGFIAEVSEPVTFCGESSNRALR